MIAAFHFDNWLFILLIAVAMLFRWLASLASKASKGSDETDERSTSTPPTPGPARTVPRAPVESDEQRIRKFLEALGQPAGSQPPPLVAHRPTYQKPVMLPHVGPFGSPLPPLTMEIDKANASSTDVALDNITMLERDMVFMIHPNQHLPETGYLLCGEPVLLTARALSS